MPKGTTQSRRPRLCIQRIQRLPKLASAAAACSFRSRVCDPGRRAALPGRRDPDDAWCVSSALKLVLVLVRVLGRCAVDVEAGDAAREETGESGGVRSQCWLAELSMRCRRGVGAMISRRSGKGLHRRTGRRECATTVVGGEVYLEGVLPEWRRGDSARVETGLALGA